MAILKLSCRTIQRADRRLVAYLAAALIALLSPLPASAQIISANFNGVPRQVESELFGPSRNLWARGFFNMFDLLGDSALQQHPDVQGFRRAADAGQQLMVSFKWAFEDANVPVPLPYSSDEQALFDLATQALLAIDRPVNTIVLGNEPMWETFGSDLQRSGPNNTVPYVTFTERLLDHLDTSFGQTQSTAPEYFLGSLNRVDQSNNQNKDVVQELFRVARENPLVSGMDLHVHFNSQSEAEAMLAYGRAQLGPDKDIIVTEFSPVWRYKDALDDPIDATSAGNQFAQDYGYAPNTLVGDYLKNAFANQVTRTEWTDFIESQPWFNENHLADMHALFREYDVSIATLGFAQPLSMRGLDPTRPGYSPFHINWLYINALVEGSRLEAYNEHYMDDWLTSQDLLADFDRDGQIDLEDYLTLRNNQLLDLSSLSNVQSLQLGDMNLDRTIDPLDLELFAAAFESANGTPFTLGPADINGDLSIDGEDWVILLENMVRDLQAESFPQELWPLLGDIDGSGRVDRLDFREFKTAYELFHGPDSFASLIRAVPEPTTVILLSASLVVWGLVRRCRARRAANCPDPS